MDSNNSIFRILSILWYLLHSSLASTPQNQTVVHRFIQLINRKCFVCSSNTEPFFRGNDTTELIPFCEKDCFDELITMDKQNLIATRQNKENRVFAIPLPRQIMEHILLFGL